MMVRPAIVAALLVGCVASTGAAQIDADARHVLEESAAAMRGVSGVAFESNVSGTSILKGYIDVSGKVKLWKGRGSGVVCWRVEGNSRVRGFADHRFVVVWDGSVVRWTEDGVAVVRERPITDADAAKVLTPCWELMTREWVDPGAYDTALTRFETLTRVQGLVVGGETCDVVRAASTANRYREWTIGSEDHLLRSVRAGALEGGDDIAKITEISGLRAFEFTDEVLAVSLLPPVFVPGQPPARAVSPPVRVVAPGPPEPERLSDEDVVRWLWNKMGAAWGPAARWMVVVLVLMCGVLAVVHGRRWWKR